MPRSNHSEPRRRRGAFLDRIVGIAGVVSLCTFAGLLTLGCGGSNAPPAPVDESDTAYVPPDDTAAPVDSGRDTASAPDDAAPGTDTATMPECLNLSLGRRSTHFVSPAGVRSVFSVTECGDEQTPVDDLLSKGSVTIINDATGKEFGTEGGVAPTVRQARDFSFYSVLILDLSRSIVDNNRLGDVIAGAKAFVKQMVQQPSDSRKKHHVQIYAFGSTAASKWETTEFTQDAQKLLNLLDQLKQDSGRGSTNLYGAFEQGLDELMQVQRTQQTGRLVRSSVLLTDGTHQTGNTDSMRKSALSKLSSSDVDSYTIGIKGNYDPAAIRELASNPNNFVLAKNSSQLVQAFGDISKRLEAWSDSHYVVGICSPLEVSKASFTIRAKYGDKEGSARVWYDAGGFNLQDCKPKDVVDSDGQRQFPQHADIKARAKKRGNLMCSNVCPYSGDGECDDGRSGAATSACPSGTDCDDCGAHGDSQMTWEVVDTCRDGRDIRYRLFAQSSGYVWPSDGSSYRTAGYGSTSTETIQCNSGTSVCFGGNSGGDSYWGIGLDGNEACSSDTCCYSCGIEDPSFNLVCE